MSEENPHGIFTMAQTEISSILREPVLDHDLEIGDMSKEQILEFADAFREVANYARHFERHLRTEAKHSFY